MDPGRLKITDGAARRAGHERNLTRLIAMAAEALMRRFIMIYRTTAQAFIPLVSKFHFSADFIILSQVTSVPS